MKTVWTTTKDKRKLKKLYLSVLPVIRKVARKSGYAIGVHGSMIRDFDLIAVPWTKKAVKPITLVIRIEKAVVTYPHGMEYHWKAVARNKGYKPHGRIAFAIYLGTNAYLDLSIIPAIMG